jgi:glycerol-3-phosphate dehydrogenase subunit C
VKVPPPELPSTEWSYDDPDHLDPAKLERELRRVAEVCHQCRRCLPLCPSFPRLFELIDATGREVPGVELAGFEEVNELCYHCKLCYNHCPYTPPHEWDVDFPALMRRQQLFRAKRDGVPVARRLTTRTDLIGKLASLAPPLMNFANRNRASRVLMEKTVGIHRDWVQPSYCFDTVSRWFRRRGPRGDGRSGEAVLFTTCSVEYSDPLVARSAVAVLERSGVRVDVAYERCCGMPFTDVGDLDAARRNAERNVAELLPHVERGASVVVPGPSCSLMLKEEYPKLLPGEASQRVAAATKDLMEYVYDLARAKLLDRDFRERLGKVAYHAPCHLRAQNIGFRSRDVLRLAAEEVELVEACSGVDGTWGMQARFHEASLQVARKLLETLERSGAEHFATDCPLAALRIEEGLRRKATHPIVLLRHAYGIPAD